MIDVALSILALIAGGGDHGAFRRCFATTGLPRPSKPRIASPGEGSPGSLPSRESQLKASLIWRLMNTSSSKPEEVGETLEHNSVRPTEI